jgi:sugar phosphate permease
MQSSSVEVSSRTPSVVCLLRVFSMEWKGTLGHAAWRWLFYTEGAATVAVAIIAVFVLPDFPATTKWLTPAERRLAELRMEEDAGVVDEVSDRDCLTEIIPAHSSTTGRQARAGLARILDGSW